MKFKALPYQRQPLFERKMVVKLPVQFETTFSRMSMNGLFCIILTASVNCRLLWIHGEDIFNRKHKTIPNHLYEEKHIDQLREQGELRMDGSRQYVRIEHREEIYFC